MKKVFRNALMAMIIFVISFTLTACSKPPVSVEVPAWQQYYDDAIDVLGDYPHTFQVLESWEDIDEDWIIDTTDEDWEDILGITSTSGYGNQWDPGYEWDSIYYIDFTQVLECHVYIFVPDVEVIFHEMIHVWDSHHYGLNLTEMETSYLAWKLMLYKDYTLEAANFYEESMLREDHYSFQHLDEDIIDKVNDIYKVILGVL